ncbi:MAG: 1-acyl-sn-glycerol-3-phosphate acyltransferase, partial [bacterium]
MLTRLLTAASPTDLLTGRFDPASRIRVQGEVELLARLGAKHTLVLAPTHLSNLDSPLLGYALYAAGLPPVIYGAGLNLFSNPAMAFFMRRLGAYTVDRRKKHELYKDVLK